MSATNPKRLPYRRDTYPGQMLRYNRRLQGLTLHEAGKAIGVTRAAFAYYELNRGRPRLHTARRISEKFNVDWRLWYPEYNDAKVFPEYNAAKD